MKFSHLIYRTPLIYLWYCIRMCVVWKGATAPCPGAGGVGDGHWHMHTPSPGTFSFVRPRHNCVPAEAVVRGVVLCRSWRSF